MVSLCLSIPAVHAINNPGMSTLDSIKAQLPLLTTAADSVRALYDIFDLAPSENYRQVLTTLFQVARRAGDQEAELDAARRFTASFLSSDSVSKVIETTLLELPYSRERDETILFIKVQHSMFKASSLSQEEKIKKITELIADDNDYEEGVGSHDQLEHIHKLYTLIIYLSDGFSSNILPEYIDKLGKMLTGIKLYALRNQFYTQAANTYSNIGDAGKSIAADRNLLAIIDQLETEALARGRKFASYDRHRYTCYRRMLGNFKALSQDEINDINSKIEAIAKKSKRMGNYIAKDDLLHSYYYMATGQYDKAIVAIKKQLKLHNSIGRRLRLLNLLISAAKTSGDNNTHIQAMHDYNSMLEEYNKENAAQKYRELQIKYDVHQLKADKAKLEIEKRDKEIKSAYRVMIIITIGLVLVSILLIMLYRSYRKTKDLSVKLAATVDNLEKERDSLKKMQAELVTAYERAETSNRAKDEFLHSMSHELRTPLNAILGFSREIIRRLPGGYPAEKISRSCGIMVKNGEQLEKIIDDMLYLSSTENDYHTDLTTETATAWRIMTESAAAINGQVANGVIFNVKESEDAYTEVNTDVKSANRVLINLLNNAVKFTHKGYVELSCEVDREAKLLKFIVTDTGCGVPLDKRETIFERFTKLDTFNSGVGLGLFISQQIAGKLGGKVYLDSSCCDPECETGSRFVFALPL